MTILKALGAKRDDYSIAPAIDSANAFARERLTDILVGCIAPTRVFCLRLLAMSDQKSNDHLHGITLERIVTELSAHFGWEEMARRVPVRCFQFDPSVKSSLTFLRKTPWARAKVEDMFVRWKLTGS